ncbi:MAG: OmpA family protein [Flavobacteriales bacterium]|nr:OmpA family protein [Flavobacteriales bacterium]
MKKILVLVALTLSLGSCVSSKIHKDLQTKYDQISGEKKLLEEENQSLQSELDDSQSNLKSAESELSALKEDSELLKRKYSALEKDHASLLESYNLLTNSNDALLAKNAQKNLDLLKDLENSRALLAEENAKLESKEKKIKELEYLMRERENTLSAMKKSLSDALRGFEGKGLTVEQRNGKVYVSLENRLLFPSGSWTVNSLGKGAINDLAKVLSTQDDINILIEGHTDADAYRGNGTLLDNWDLSVKRSTAIVRLLLNTNGIDPTRITAAGRSKYIPVATNKTVEGKSKNRRIEVIIEPDLSKIEAMLSGL